jgi:casein kinase 1
MANEVLIHNRFVLNRKIGKGAYGVVHLGYDKLKHQLVAIKLEHQDNNNKRRLEYEYGIYKCMNHKRMPKIHWYGTEGEYKILVMDLLGNSLDQLFNLSGRKFTIKTTIVLGIQMIDLIESIHVCRHIHRDIKPENFMIGVNDNRHFLYIIDFGLSKRFKNDKKVHDKMITGKKLVGTPRYASINSHLGYELSRRDDLESIGYMLIYFLKGTLPWMGLPGDTKEERYRSIKNKKIKTTVDELCKNLPIEFKLYLTYIRSLKYKEKPNYNYVKNLFFDMSKRMNIKLDYNYDWTGKLFGKI